MSKKSKLLLVGSDSGYLMPLLIKSVRDHSEEIDVEMITTPEYLSEFFSMPRELDIIVADDNMAGSWIERQSNASVFVLSENQSEEDGKSGYRSIYKYSSVNDILTTVFGESRVLEKNAGIDRSKTTKVVSVCSAKGGQGKTTVSLGIAGCLDSKYKKVLYIGAGGLQNFQCLLTNKSPISDQAVYSEIMEKETEIFKSLTGSVRNQGFDYLPPFKASLMSLGVNLGVFSGVVKTFKEIGKYDFIIVDVDQSFGESAAELIDMADHVVFVTKQDMMSAFALGQLCSNISVSNSEKYIFLCNDFKPDETNFLIDGDVISNVSISEYFSHISPERALKLECLAENTDIQRLVYLLM